MSYNKGMTSDSLARQAFFSFVFLALLYAVFGIPVRFLASQFTILQQMYLWLLSGACISFVLFRKSIRPKIVQGISRRDVFLLFLRATFFYTIGTTLWCFSINPAKYSNIAFISAIPTSAVLGMLFFHEKVNMPKALALGGAAVGLLLITLKTTQYGFSWGIGEAAAVLSLMFYPFSYAVRKLQKDPLNDAETTTLILGIAGFSALFLSFILGEKLDSAQFDLITICVIAAAGFMNIGMQYLLNVGFRQSEMIVGGVILNLDIVFTLLVSIFVFAEIPSIREAIGGCIICISAITMKRFSDKV